MTTATFLVTVMQSGAKLKEEKILNSEHSITEGLVI
jgi:hypothetical protein